MKAALELAVDAAEAGWTVKINPQSDTGGAPFVVVEGLARDGRYFYACWHTRTTGTYRLFGSPTLGKSMRSASPSSVKAIRAAFEATE